MRILIINTLYPPIQVGGAEKSVSLLAEALGRTGDEVAVVSLHPEKGESFEERNRVRVYRLPLDNRYWPFTRKERGSLLSRQLWHMADMSNRRAAQRVGEILDKEKPDLVHTNNLLGFSVAAWNEVKKRKIRLVHTLRDYYLLCPRCTIFRKGLVCERRCVECVAMTLNRKPASRCVDAVVANSRYVLDKHRQHGYFEGVPRSVIYNIADTSMKVTPRAPESADNTLVLGFIGKIEPEKGIEVVLEATRLLKNSNWRLRIAGGGLESCIEDLKHRYADPRIEWLGFVSAEDFYSSIDVSLIASIWAEPLPRSLIETFAAGKSAICAQSGGTPEIASLGKVVETYAARDTIALAAIIDQALTNLDRWRGGGPIDATALDAFSEAAITSAYRAVYSGTPTERPATGT
jgi:glycosyltransferase involved in cell wall biosynthesis